MFLSVFIKTNKKRKEIVIKKSNATLFSARVQAAKQCSNETLLKAGFVFDN